MILDATAGNRTMWQKKNIKDIIYLDIEKMIKVKPIIYADNTSTPFLPGSFDTIFYDPPHDYGRDDTDILEMSRTQLKCARKHERRLHNYYGYKYAKNRVTMIKLLYGANKEFNRILKDEGLLWLKWCEIKLPVHRMLTIFDNFTVLMLLPITSPQHTMGKQQTYWVCMKKKLSETAQSSF